MDLQPRVRPNPLQRLPTSGLVLLFGNPGSGKDAAVLRPLVRAHALDGRRISIFDSPHKKSTLALPAISKAASDANNTAPVVIVNEAATLFGHWPNKLFETGGPYFSCPTPDKAAELGKLLLQKIAEPASFSVLFVLSFQSFGSVERAILPTLLLHAKAEIFLRNRHVHAPIDDHIADRHGGQRRFPSVDTLEVDVGRRVTQAIVSTFNGKTWETSVELLPMLFREDDETPVFLTSGR